MNDNVTDIASPGSCKKAAAAINLKVIDDLYEGSARWIATSLKTAAILKEVFGFNGPRF